MQALTSSSNKNECLTGNVHNCIPINLLIITKVLIKCGIGHLFIFYFAFIQIARALSSVSLELKAVLLIEKQVFIQGIIYALARNQECDSREAIRRVRNVHSYTARY